VLEKESFHCRIIWVIVVVKTSRFKGGGGSVGWVNSRVKGGVGASVGWGNSRVKGGVGASVGWGNSRLLGEEGVTIGWGNK